MAPMRSRILRLGSRTFASLKVANYRIYFTGQSISLIGTWMQTTAQAWLVLQLTHSATDLGLVVAIQALPVLVLAPYGGVIADRVDKRKMMAVLQALMGLQALALGLLVVFGIARFWEVCVLAIFLGLNNVFENPSRQAFIREMVGRDKLRNAVTLNSVMTNGARAVGPAVAGVLIATVGVGICFFLNAVSFVAVVTSLLVMDKAALRPSPPEPKAKGQIREGLSYAARTTEIIVPLVMMGLIGTFAYEFTVSLPVLATATYHGGSEVYGFMTASMGIGAVVGGLVTASRGRTGVRPVIIGATGFGFAILFTALAPSLAFAYLGLLFVGWGSVSFVSVGNSTIQLNSKPTMRGRALSLWQLAFQGTTPIGGPAIGWVISESDPRAGLSVGAASCFAAVLAGLALVHRRRRTGDGSAGQAPTVLAASSSTMTAA